MVNQAHMDSDCGVWSKCRFIGSMLVIRSILPRRCAYPPTRLLFTKPPPPQMASLMETSLDHVWLHKNMLIVSINKLVIISWYCVVVYPLTVSYLGDRHNDIMYYKSVTGWAWSPSCNYNVCISRRSDTVHSSSSAA